VWGVAEEIVEAQGIALIVVLDTSTSMDAQDVLPSRLERAKRAAQELFQGAEGNQLGLVLFAGSAFVQVPLTTDASAALTFLEAASTQSISRQGTALADALALAIETFDERIVSNGIVVVLSDGENHQGDPVAMAEIAAEAGLTIHAIGYGNPDDGEPIPIISPEGTFTGEYKTNASDNLVLSRLDEATLQQVAEVTGGTYQRASDSGIEVVNLLNIIRDLEGDLLERRLETRQIERFEIFVGLALLALTVNLALGYTRVGPHES
jgi:Ca-activated chloride channel family protein